MAYMARNERRIEVLEAVIHIAATDGFSAAPVRRVGSELAMSAGNIHHLFGSASALRREAFQQFAELEFAAIAAETGQSPPMEQLQTYLYCVAIGPDRASQRIWQSAGIEAAKDPKFSETWHQESERWVDRVSDLLLALADNGASRVAATSAAWRLMSFAVGVSVYIGTEGQVLNQSTFTRDLAMLVGNELDGLKQTPHSITAVECAMIDRPLSIGRL